MIKSKKVRVLIAEDDYLVGREISNALDKIGYENIGIATNGKIAVEMACSQKPDVVLMDIKMPELNGFEATKEIQERYKIPVVILTAYESEEFIEKVKNMGIYAYILKPPVPTEIKRNICIALARHNDLMECNRLNEILQIEITKRKKAEKKLQQHAIELQERNEELDAFAHTVAHDLKNPLGTVMGFADLLNEDYSNLSEDEITSYIASISQDSIKMNHIIDELLLLSSLRKTEVKMSPLNMSEIIAEAIERLSQMIEDYNAEIILSEDWKITLGYASWVVEVWVNYISNAIKYGGKPPRIEIGSDTGKSKNIPEGMIRFWIRDNGPGISPDDQKLLFRKFERLDQAQTKGYGLGLSIVLRIIEKLGGQVEVESETGKGSSFYFTLPRESNKIKDKSKKKLAVAVKL